MRICWLESVVWTSVGGVDQVYRSWEAERSMTRNWGVRGLPEALKVVRRFSWLVLGM